MSSQPVHFKGHSSQPVSFVGGASTGFGGPIELSGYALSKKFMLETMDNYVQFMSDQLNLFSQNVQMYSISITSQASNERSQILSSAAQDLAGAMGAGFTMIMTSRANATLREGNAGLSEEETGLNSHLDNLDNFQKEFEGIENDPDSFEVEDGEEGVASAAATGEPETPEAMIDQLEKRDSLEEIHEGKVPAEKRTKYKVAYKKIVEERDRARASGNHAEAERHKASLNRVRKALGTSRKELRQKLQICSERQTRNSNIANSSINAATAYGNAFSSLGKATAGTIQGFTKAAATYAQANTQITQSILGTSEKTAQEMSSHAQDVIQLERQIQANNVTRG